MKNVPLVGQLPRACALLLALGCSREPELGADLPIAPSGSAVAKPPVDRLAPGELAEGSDKAFGLVLPTKLRVERRFVDSVHASGAVSPEDLSNYVRQRVLVAEVEVGAARTVFPRVTIKSGDPSRVYRVEVAPKPGGGSELSLRDVTPKPIPQGLSDAERWKRAGMNPDGTPLNPKQQQ